MTLFDLVAKLTLDSSEYEKGIDGARGKANSLLHTLDGAANKIIKVGTVAAGAAAAGITAFATASVKTGMQFDASMSQVAATMGVTTDEIKDLRDYAQKMGAETAFSASQAADALNYMALAGYDAETSMQMLPNVLNLAAAGGMELATASDMITDSQSALGLSISETNALVDKMAKASSKSNTSVSQLGEAILTVGGTAKNIKGGTTALATSLGILADNGIKGAEGGTALRNIINTLAAPTGNAAKRFETLGVKVFDSTGSMRGLNEIFGDLDDSMKTLTQEQRMEALSDIFNVRDLKSAEALLANYGDRWDELSKEIDNAQGAAQKMADTQLDNLQGDVTILKSAIDGAKQSVSDGLTPALRNVVKDITRYISSSKSQKFLKDVGKKLGDIVNVITHKIGVALPRMAKLFDNGGKTVKIFGVALAGTIVIIKSATSVVGALTSAMGLLVGGLAVYSLTNEKALKHVVNLNKKEQELVDTVSDHAESYKELDKTRQDRMKSIDDETEKVEGLWKELQTLAGESGNVKDADKDRAQYIIGELNDALGTEYTMNGNIIQNYKDMQTEIDKLIRKRRASLYLEAFGDQYKEALTNQSKALEAVSVAEEKLRKQEEETQKARDDLANTTAVTYNFTETVEHREAREALEAAEAAEEEARRELNNIRNQAYEDTAIIGAYENASDAFERGEYDASQGFLRRWNQPTSAEQLSGGAARQAAAQQAEVVKSAERERDAYEQGLNAGKAGFTQEGLEERNKAVEEATELLKEYGKAAGWAAYQVEDGAEREVTATKNAANKMGDINSMSLKDLIDVFRQKEKEVAEYKANYEAGVDGFTKPELDELQKSLEEMRKVLSSKVFEAEDTGKNIGLGLANGIKSTRQQVAEAADDVARIAITRMQAVPQVASPSKVTKKIGSYIGQGLAIGMRSEIDNVESAATDLAESALMEPQNNYYNSGRSYAQNTTAANNNRNSGILGELLDVLRDIRANMGYDLVLDTGVVAGAVDRVLGRTAYMKARGN